MPPESRIATKRWDDPTSPDDGTRILITRFRPRALPKDQETWSEWQRDLGPSPELHAAAYGKGQPAIGWSTYVSRYRREMLPARPIIIALAQRVLAGEKITLLCSSQCTRESRCHRSLLRDMILSEAHRLSPGDA